MAPLKARLITIPPSKPPPPPRKDSWPNAPSVTEYGEKQLSPRLVALLQSKLAEKDDAGGVWASLMDSGPRSALLQDSFSVAVDVHDIQPMVSPENPRKRYPPLSNKLSTTSLTTLAEEKERNQPSKRRDEKPKRTKKQEVVEKNEYPLQYLPQTTYQDPRLAPRALEPRHKQSLVSADDMRMNGSVSPAPSIGSMLPSQKQGSIAALKRSNQPTSHNSSRIPMTSDVIGSNHHAEKADVHTAKFPTMSPVLDDSHHDQQANVRNPSKNPMMNSARISTHHDQPANLYNPSKIPMMSSVITTSNHDQQVDVPRRRRKTFRLSNMTTSEGQTLNSVKYQPTSEATIATLPAAAFRKPSVAQLEDARRWSRSSRMVSASQLGTLHGYHSTPELSIISSNVSSRMSYRAFTQSQIFDPEFQPFANSFDRLSLAFIPKNDPNQAPLAEYRPTTSNPSGELHSLRHPHPGMESRMLQRRKMQESSESPESAFATIFKELKDTIKLGNHAPCLTPSGAPSPLPLCARPDGVDEILQKKQSKRRRFWWWRRSKKNHRAY